MEMGIFLSIKDNPTTKLQTGGGQQDREAQMGRKNTQDKTDFISSRGPVLNPVYMKWNIYESIYINIYIHIIYS